MKTQIRSEIYEKICLTVRSEIHNVTVCFRTERFRNYCSIRCLESLHDFRYFNVSRKTTFWFPWYANLLDLKFETESIRNGIYIDMKFKASQKCPLCRGYRIFVFEEQFQSTLNNWERKQRRRKNTTMMKPEWWTESNYDDQILKTRQSTGYFAIIHMLPEPYHNLTSNLQKCQFILSHSV